MKASKLFTIIMTLLLVLLLASVSGCGGNKGKINDNITKGYELGKQSVEQLKVITNGLCESGVIQADECLKLEGIYAGIDILIPILDKLSLAIFHSPEKDQPFYIADYILQLAEFNSSYYELITIVNRYKNG